MLLSLAEVSIADDDDHASVPIRDGSAISTLILSATAPNGCFVLGCRSSGDGDCGEAM